MKPLYVLILAGLLPLAAWAETPTPASAISLIDLLYLKRPVIVFADSPADPAFIRQLDLLSRDPDALVARDVFVITDTVPFPASAIRLKLRPRGFALVLIDKDGKTTLRKPLPWDVREITRAIDKLPSRREEILQPNP